MRDLDVVARALWAESAEMIRVIDGMPKLPEGLSDAMNLPEPSKVIREGAALLSSEGFKAFDSPDVDAWLALERDAKVRQKLRSALMVRAAMAAWHTALVVYPIAGSTTTGCPAEAASKRLYEIADRLK